MTYRDRRLAKAERLEGWAESRDAKADAAHERSSAISDQIPFGQPILVGHHSEGRARRDAARIANGMDRAVEHGRKADEMRSRAANIKAAADHAIYSDDPDAVVRLREKIAGLEAERARIVAYNKTCRKGAPDPSLLTGEQKVQLAGVLRYASFQSKGGAFPSYATANLSGQISAARKRLAALDPGPVDHHPTDVSWRGEEAHDQGPDGRLGVAATGGLPGRLGGGGQGYACSDPRQP